VTIWLGIVHVVSWIGFLIYVVVARPATIPGIAIPEAIGSLAFAGWLLATAREFLTGDASDAEPVVGGRNDR